MINKERLTGLDSLRVVMVFFVIALHCGMTYMDYRPDWWYVLDSKQDIGFTYMVIILDYFPMTVLFFLAGYFTPPSFAKRGVKSFINNKFLHICIPWILGVILVAPFFSRATFISLGYPSISIFNYFYKYFFSSLYQQAHYWFLGVLFLFFMVYSLVAAKKREVTSKKSKKQISPLVSIILICALTAITYYLSTKYYKPVSGWTNIGYVLYFQPARFVGYAIAFILGVFGCKQKWFTKEGWKPSIYYLVVGIIGSIWLIYWKFNLTSIFSKDQNLMIDSITYSIVSVCMTFGLISVFLPKQSIGSIPLLSKIAPYSYGIYWIHQIAAMLIMHYLMSFNIPALAKWTLAVLFTIIVSVLITKYVFKKTPLLKQIF